MFLKQLDTVGFKSFAERTKIDFVEGVTAVVGPNGSGKSNIIDAVRWVLGEQSAKSLRGTKMEDVIFQGSDSRHALNFAEVTLVLNNELNQLPIDYEEVSITRRVYRSGDSEFYINKQTCRLKDIIDLFMDSGLGKEAFTIIGQGKVEEILSSKAEERRAIFEEAAGVLKYKQRKRQAEFKLVETEDNLDRVEDIIHEIEQQIEPLEKQAETAKLFIEKRQRLKSVEISMLVTEIAEKHQTWHSILNEITKLKDEEIELSTFIQKEEIKLTKNKEIKKQIEIEIEEIQKQLLIATEELENTEGKKNVLQERLKHFTENKINLETTLNETIEQKNKAKEALEKENLILNELSNKQDMLLKRINNLKNKLEYTEEALADQIENLKADYIQKLNEQAVKKNELNIAMKRIEQIKNANESESLNQKDKISERESLKKDLQKHENLMKKENDYLSEISNEIKNKTINLDENEKKYETMRNKLQEAQQTIAKLNSRKETLEEMRESFQGYFYGVKEVLKASKENKLFDIHGVVVDLIDVPTDYITAIDTVLGGQAQNIIVKNDSSARKAINWLKKENKGRATFLPIESMSDRTIPENILSRLKLHPGFVGPAAKLVQTDLIYQKVVNNLMGNIIVANTLKSANELAEITNRRYRIVTLEGDVVYPGGSMSGGAKRKVNQSLFTREKDLAELTKKLVEFVERTQAFEKETTQENHFIKNQKQEILIKNQARNKQTAYIDQISKEHQNIKVKYQQVNDDLLVYDMNQKQMKIEQKEHNEKINRTNEQLLELSVRLTEIDNEIKQLTKKQKLESENQSKLNSELHKLEVEFAQSDQRLKHQKQSNDRAIQEVGMLEAKEIELKNELISLNNLKKEEITNEDMSQMVIEKERRKEQISFELTKQRKRLTEVDVLINDDERELTEEIKKQKRLSIQLQEKEVKSNRLDVSLETQISHLQTTYSISFERASKEYKPTDNITEAKSTVNRLKNEIKNLGNVNTGAIEEFKRIKERYTFMTSQQKDLLEAKQTLYEIISEMDEEMITLFSDTFQQIQKEFTLVFKELFGGGHAELTLSDPNNLLDTGIDIVARPPGKKLKSLSLLSGGERSLTAIALLFSILKVRPVPFCILDEVEAALDEANVVRFAKYVKMHSDDIQFIVITHRRGTMEEADALYGVTMQESGVSRLVSVRLEDTDFLEES